jgi:hypothetical protein
MKKAHNIFEVALLLCFVVAVSVVAFTMYNNQKIKLADMSKISVKSQAVDSTSQVLKMSSPSALKSAQAPAVNNTETAGTNALTYLDMSSSEFEAAVANVTIADLTAAATSNEKENIFTLANSLIQQLNLNYAPLNSSLINESTISILTGILNEAVVAATSEDTSANVKTVAENYINSFEALIK